MMKKAFLGMLLATMLTGNVAGAAAMDEAKDTAAKVKVEEAVITADDVAVDDNDKVKADSAEEVTAEEAPAEEVEQKMEVRKIPTVAEILARDVLHFDSSKNYTVETQLVNGEEVSYRAYKNLPYVTNPVAKEVQVLNIYIPTAYFEADTKDENGRKVAKTLNGFTSATAPIFFPNAVGGYMEAGPIEPALSGGVDGMASRMGRVHNAELGVGKAASVQQPNAALLALSKGYVVASAGARGRETVRQYEVEVADGGPQDAEVVAPEQAEYIGKAPAGILDLKAALRYLHYNDAVMPGDANKIISNGTSAGGAMSALLGSTMDESVYAPYLASMGAASAGDSVFAVSAYCPITNLENADAAYEWNMQGIKNYTKMNMGMVDGRMQRSSEQHSITAAEAKHAQELANQFVKYVNDLRLFDAFGNRIALDNNKAHSGSLVDYLDVRLTVAAQKALDAGQNLAACPEVKIEDGEVLSVDVDEHIKRIGRSKGVPAFDAFDRSSGENSLFGTEKEHDRHFTAYAQKHGTGTKTKMADAKTIMLMNPMEHIGNGSAKVAKYWRIRHGASDTDTSMAISALLALKLEYHGAQVDYELPWGVSHSGDYDLEELFAWMDKIVRPAKVKVDATTSKEK